LNESNDRGFLLSGGLLFSGGSGVQSFRQTPAGNSIKTGLFHQDVCKSACKMVEGTCMTTKFPGLVRSTRDDIWVYRRTIPKRLQPILDKKNYVKGLGTTDEVEARKKWIPYEREYKRMIRTAELQIELRGPNSKDVRREVIWSAVGRWLREYAIQNGGRLPRPLRVELPTRSRLTSHPFIFVRGLFLQWAEENAPDAALVLDMADATQGNLFFHHALVGAYFIVREMLELGPMPERTNVTPPPLPGRWRNRELR
jgi:hypothetical protein